MKITADRKMKREEDEKGTNGSMGGFVSCLVLLLFLHWTNENLHRHDAELMSRNVKCLFHN